MSTGLKANSDGSAAIQVGGSDAITLTSGGAATFLTSPTTVQAGTASAPSITFTGDTNTGIYSSGADAVDITTGGVQRGQFDSSGNFLFNSGYGSVATAYGCRAWVNFNGTANTNLSGTYSQSGTTVTVTATAHGLLAGSVIYSDITSGTGVDGIYTVATVTDANTFTYTAGTSLTTSGNITLVRSTIRGSGNVSSVADLGVGIYNINFAIAMPDANYSAMGSAMQTVVNANILYGPYVAAPSTTAYRVWTLNTSFTATDSTYVQVAFFR